MQINVECETGLAIVRQKYTILQSTLPIKLASEEENMSTLDKMVIVCCALCNCCDSVVPFD